MSVSASCPAYSTSRKRAIGTHWIEGMVDSRASLDDLEKIKIKISFSCQEVQPNKIYFNYEGWLISKVSNCIK